MKLIALTPSIAAILTRRRASDRWYAPSGAARFGAR
jgi:hypothetical protein